MTTKRRFRNVARHVTTDRNGKVAGAVQVTERDEVMLVTSGEMLTRVRASEILMVGRNTQGVKLIAVEEGHRVVSVTKDLRARGRGDRSVDPSTVSCVKRVCRRIPRKAARRKTRAARAKADGDTKPDGEGGGGGGEES